MRQINTPLPRSDSVFCRIFVRSKSQGRRPNEVAYRETIVINGHKTSVSLEEAFWTGMKEIAASCNKTLAELTSEIASQRQQGNLSSAIRLFVLDHFKTRAMNVRDGDGKPKLHAAA